MGFLRRCANETPAHDTSADAETEIRNKKSETNKCGSFIMLHVKTLKSITGAFIGLITFHLFEPWGHISADKPPVFFKRGPRKSSAVSDVSEHFSN